MAEAATEPAWLEARRQKGAALVESLPLPTPKSKGCEFTDLEALDLDRSERATCREHRVAEQERCAGDAGSRGDPGRTVEEPAEAGDTGGDEHDVRHRAHQHDGQHVAASQPLTQHEDVLGSDGDDEREAEGRAGQGCEERGGHAPNLGTVAPYVE